MVIIYVIIGIALLIFIISSFAPKSYQLEKRVRIERPLPEVYNYVRYLRNQDHWVKWNQLDPEMKKEYKSEDGKIGFQTIWESSLRKVGTGQQTITALDDNKAIYTKLEFYKPFKSESDSYIRTEKIDDNSTEVCWGFSGEMNPPMNIILFFMNADKLMGHDFEEGLASLKKVLESDAGMRLQA